MTNKSALGLGLIITAVYTFGLGSGPHNLWRVCICTDRTAYPAVGGY